MVSPANPKAIAVTIQNRLEQLAHALLAQSALSGVFIGSLYGLLGLQPVPPALRVGVGDDVGHGSGETGVERHHAEGLDAVEPEDDAAHAHHFA